MVLRIATLFLLSISVFARPVKFEKKTLEFTYDKKKHLLFYGKGDPTKLFTNELKAKAKKLSNEMYGGMNPGAFYCRTVLEGEVVYGQMGKGTNSFCKYKGFILDNGMVGYYLR